jgi:site-specific DNA recombinase
MNRAALYCRVSTEEQATEGLSIQAQREALREYAARHNLEVVAEFIDEGESARTAQRPQFQAMIRAAKQKPKPFDVILVHKSDRFARNREDAIIYKSLLRRECGIDVVSITEPLDTSSPIGRLMEGILEVIAEFYSLNLAQEVRKGMTVRASQGRGLGQCPFGFTMDEDGRLRHVPEETEIVRWIFEEYARGDLGLLKIAEFLRTQGPAVFGQAALRMKWSSVHVRKIIQNPLYAGTFVWNRTQTIDGKRKRPRDPREWVIVEGQVPQVVSRELFDRANEMLRRRRGRRSETTGDYLLRGLVFCRDCGSSMSHYSMQWRTKAGVRKVKHKLVCTRYLHSKQCYFNHVDLELLEKTVLDAIARELEGHPSGSYKIAYVPASDTIAQINRLKSQLASYGERLSRLIAAYTAGVLDLGELRREKEKLQTEKAAAQARLADLEHSLKSTPAWDSAQESTVRKALEIIADPSLPAAQRREALQTCLSRVLYSRKSGELEILLKIPADVPKPGMAASYPYPR